MNSGKVPAYLQKPPETANNINPDRRAEQAAFLRGFRVTPRRLAVAGKPLFGFHQPVALHRPDDLALVGAADIRGAGVVIGDRAGEIPGFIEVPAQYPCRNPDICTWVVADPFFGGGG